MAVISFAMVTAGATAVFRTTVEAGPTALITIGAALFVVAAGGRAVTWFKFGDTEIHTDTEAGREEVERSLEEDEPAQALASVQTAIAYDPAVLQDPMVFNTSAALYDQLVRDAVRKNVGAQVTTLSTMGPVDLEVESSGRKIAVVTKFPRAPLTRSRILELGVAVRNRDRDRDSEYSGIALVIPHTAKGRLPEFAHYFREMVGVALEVVTWSGPEDDIALKAALQRLLGTDA
ncbi:hypothetical protein [Streptacidiphilus sp. P02-A3a]|uniref:hypothetical protein n=1 Tax=Streptacidiphilus sp. P02-A3a TaxID=2704468 RepID=UPI0015FDB72E|nr:hypothetical protein [Streptacidiphilus sp. P02-A3a]QMU73231.1 hypothetical protein GXP74_38380 [Streptacidiphilus sp. P02-A3a]